MGQPAEYYGNSGLGTITFLGGEPVTLHQRSDRNGKLFATRFFGVTGSIVTLVGAFKLNSPGANGVLNAIFPFWAKWKPLLRRHVMISLKTFAPGTKTMGSSFTKSIYIFNIFYHFITFEPRISEVWKGKNLGPWGVKMAFILCVPDSFLGHLWTDFDQTFGVYRVDSELVQRHIFDFRFRPQTGSELFLHKPEIQNFGSGSQKYSRSKANRISGRK